MTPWAWVAPCVLLLSFGFHILTSVIVVYRTRRLRGSAQASVQARVSLLLAVSRHDHDLDKTLGSILGLSYPFCDRIVCVPSELDPALPVVQQALAGYPEGYAHLLVGREVISSNPKIDNLEKGWKRARGEFVFIPDANVLLRKDFVQELLALQGGNTVVASAAPLGVDAHSPASLVESAFLNTYQARLLLGGDALGFGFAHGKSVLFPRALLGGDIRALDIDVAEDSALTKIARSHGLSVRLADRPIPQPLGSRSFTTVWNRQLRWTQLRMRSFPLLFPIELLTTSAAPSLAAAFWASSEGGNPFTAALAAIALWIAIECVTARGARWPCSLSYPLVCLGREIMILVLWPAGYFHKAFVWRGNKVDLSNTYSNLSRKPSSDVK